MLILTCDSASKQGRLALVEEGDVIQEMAAAPLAEKLFSALGATFNDSGKHLNDVDLFAVVHGPGSFTGLRIGMSAMKVLSMVKNKPLVGVSNLAALATSYFETSDKNRVTCVVDAATEEFYVGEFVNEQTTAKLIGEERLAHKDTLPSIVETDVVVTTSMDKVTQHSPSLSAIEFALPNTSAIATLAKNELREGRILGPFAEPSYLKLSAAEKKFGAANYVEDCI